EQNWNRGNCGEYHEQRGDLAVAEFGDALARARLGSNNDALDSHDTMPPLPPLTMRSLIPDSKAFVVPRLCLSGHTPGGIVVGWSCRRFQDTTGFAQRLTSALGQKRTQSHALIDVRFAAESGHCRPDRGMSLCARSGHFVAALRWSAGHRTGAQRSNLVIVRSTVRVPKPLKEA